MELSDWAVAFVKSRDAIKKTLIDHERAGDLITFRHKHKVHHFLVAQKLVVPAAKDWYTVVCLQTQENVRFLVDHWAEFQQNQLSVLFVNPGLNVYWQINPKLHASIADPETLQLGIETMAQEIPFV